jgi:integrase/recombinase XerC
MEAAIENFISFLRKNRRMSEHTCIAYEHDLQQFYVFVTALGITELALLKSNHIRLWMADLMNTGTKSRSVNRKLSSLRSFFKYLRSQDRLHHDPMTKVVPPKTAKHLVKDIPAVDLEQLFLRFPWEEQQDGFRDKLLLLMLYTTGMRLSELIQLKKSDVDFGRNLLRVTGKRNKMREVPLHSELADTLELYLRNHPHSWVFVRSERGEPLYPVLVYRLVTRYLGLFSSASKISPHVLRHSFATHMLNNGAPLLAIKDLLGHASLSATQVYTKNSFEKLKRIHQLHPRN